MNCFGEYQTTKAAVVPESVEVSSFAWWKLSCFVHSNHAIPIQTSFPKTVVFIDF